MLEYEEGCPGTFKLDMMVVSGGEGEEKIRGGGVRAANSGIGFYMRSGWAIGWLVTRHSNTTHIAGLLAAWSGHSCSSQRSVCQSATQAVPPFVRPSPLIAVSWPSSPRMVRNSVASAAAPRSSVSGRISTSRATCEKGRKMKESRPPQANA